VSPRFCIHGGKLSIIILMLIVSFRVVASRRMVRVGPPAGLDLFSRSCALARVPDAKAFASALASLRKTEWVVYAKQPFGGPKQVLAYLAHYTHRIAIANSRLLDLDETHVSFRWKDYRQNGVHKNKVMRIEIAEFIRRFLLHILPSGFHRVRYYGLFANGHRGEKLALCRTLLDVRTAPTDRSNDDDIDPGASDHIDPSVANHEPPPCPCCGGRMKVFESFNGPFSRPYHVRRLDAL
jgi:hypothetical protein